jgi:hypothetical protein
MKQCYGWLIDKMRKDRGGESQGTKAAQGGARMFNREAGGTQRLAELFLIQTANLMDRQQ